MQYTQHLDALDKGPLEDDEFATAVDGKKAEIRIQRLVGLVPRAHAGHDHERLKGRIRREQEADRSLRAALVLDLLRQVGDLLFEANNNGTDYEASLVRKAFSDVCRNHRWPVHATLSRSAYRATN